MLFGERERGNVTQSDVKESNLRLAPQMIPFFVISCNVFTASNTSPRGILFGIHLGVGL